MLTKLYPFQEEDVTSIQKANGRVLLASEMGTGKTIVALTWVHRYMKKGITLVVCPASLKWNWKAEALKHVNLRSHIIEGKRPGKNPFARITQAGILIINYEILSTWLPYLRQINIRCVIADEVHYAKSIKAQRTKALQAVCDDIPHVILISGTPLTNRPVELWPALTILRPDVFRNFRKFAFKYTKPEWTFWGWRYNGAANLRHLHNVLKRKCHMIRRKKEDILKDLPSKQRSVVSIKLAPKEQSDYAKAEKEFVKWLQDNFDKKSPRRGLDRAVQMGYLKRFIGELKLKYVMEWIDNFLESSSGKLIVFGVHKKIMEPLYEHYQDRGVLVNGKIIGKKRQQAFEQFTKDPNVRLFFGNIQAAGVGWNGCVAQDTLFAEFAWTPGDHTQAEDRTHRIGQNKKVTNWYLMVPGTIEETICKMIQTKQKNLNEVLDGKTEGGFDVQTLIEDELLARYKTIL